jgi:hypothetical protein
MGNKKNNAKEEAIKTSQTLNKTYSYTKQGVQLNFTLNVKSAVELKTFIELMEKATEDINEDIKNLE